jgi:hypothetical protein
VLVVTTGVNVVLAELVETALPRENHAFESSDPYNCTEPAETPELEFTTMIAVVLVVSASNTTGVDVVADLPLSETTGAIPRL